MTTIRPHLIAVVPVGRLEGAKSRLGAVLDAEERQDLATRLLAATLDALRRTAGIAETYVITPDDDVRAMALAAGARPLRQGAGGLNEGIRAARDEAIAAGAEAILIVPLDLPAISWATLTPIVDTLAEPERPLITIVADRHARGTNALLLAPPDAIEPQFGGDSFAAHRTAADEAGAVLVELGGPLALDIDTPDDLLLAEATDRALVGG